MPYAKCQSMKPQKTKLAATLEGVAWVTGVGVLLNLMMPEFRRAMPTLISGAGLIAGCWMAWWLGAKPNRNHVQPDSVLGSASVALPHAMPASSTLPFGVQSFHSCLVTPEPDLSEKLRNLDTPSFETIIKLLFQERGFNVATPSPASSALSLKGEMDFTLESIQEHFGLQFRHWKNSKLTVQPIHALAQSMSQAGINGGLLIVLAGGSEDLNKLAEKLGIQILNDTDIIEMLVESGLLYDHRVMDLLAGKSPVFSS